MNWLIYSGLAIVVIVICIVAWYWKIRADYDAWVLQHGDFMLFDKVEFDDYWRGRVDVRNKTTQNIYVFYRVDFTAQGHDFTIMFRAPTPYRRLHTADKVQMFKLHYLHIYDTIPTDVTLTFECYA